MEYKKIATNLGVKLKHSKNNEMKFDVCDYNNQFICSIGDISYIDFFQATDISVSFGLSVQWKYFKDFDEANYLKYGRYYYEYKILFNL